VNIGFFLHAWYYAYVLCNSVKPRQFVELLSGDIWIVIDDNVMNIEEFGNILFD
jgi:hypothetical protein